MLKPFIAIHCTKNSKSRRNYQFEEVESPYRSLVEIVESLSNTLKIRKPINKTASKTGTINFSLFLNFLANECRWLL
jgi:hypothetical protein